MRLLYDHNLSPRLVSWLSDLFPGSEHVSMVGMDTRPDTELWEYAKSTGFVLVSKDSDFYDLALLRGFPPRFIWLRLGNCTSRQIEQIMRDHSDAISEFENDSGSGVLILS